MRTLSLLSPCVLRYLSRPRNMCTASHHQKPAESHWSKRHVLHDPVSLLLFTDIGLVFVSSHVLSGHDIASFVTSVSSLFAMFRVESVDEDRWLQVVIRQLDCAIIVSFWSTKYEPACEWVTRDALFTITAGAVHCTVRRHQRSTSSLGTHFEVI